MDCFILKSGCKDACVAKTMESLWPIGAYIKEVSHIDQINIEDKQTEWFGVFYDNEFISTGLLNSLPIYLKYAEEDCLVLFKYAGKNALIKSPKIFRHTVMLRKNQLLPEGPYSFNTVLDGFVWNHDQHPV